MKVTSEKLRSGSQLDPERVVDTIEQLSRRIVERFPDAGLLEASDELLCLSKETKERATWIGRPIMSLRLLAAAVFFLVTAETRVKRRRALAAIHELRSLAHVIDMHQLTKDPDRLIFSGGDTVSSPTNDMGMFEMSRYLDYCVEMLSFWK